MLTKPKYLLNIPNMDAGKVQQVILKHSTQADFPLVELSEFKKNLNNNDFVKNCAVVLIEPAQRLYRAYQSEILTYPDRELSFSEFYREPRRVNLYSRVFKRIEPKDIGCIGIHENFFQSVLLLADWLEVNLTRIPYNSFYLTDKQNTLKKEDLQEISTLYADDYDFFLRAKSVFEARYKSYLVSKRLKIAPGKKIIVHVGPPKTGTSAIQAWLKKNNDRLKSNGFLYPEHKSDSNGVSSGNFEFVISRDASGRDYLDDLKLRKNIALFNKSQCDTLLLSSEHFYYFLIWLFTRLPEAKFIFYIRHPLAISESAFHQQVKRHLRTKDYILPKDMAFTSLKTIAYFAEQFSISVDYRFFAQRLFKDGTLLRDFAHCIGLPSPHTVDDTRLNTKYSPGAVSIMRCCNGFSTPDLLRDLDIFLQRYSESYPSYSLIDELDMNKVKESITQNIALITDRYPTIDKEKLVRLADTYEEPAKISQLEVQRDVALIFSILKRDSKTLCRRLYFQAKRNNHLPNAKQILEDLNLSRVSKLLFEIRLFLTSIVKKRPYES